jgi:hypothetical protein
VVDGRGCSRGPGGRRRGVRGAGRARGRVGKARSREGVAIAAKPLRNLGLRAPYAGGKRRRIGGIARRLWCGGERGSGGEVWGKRGEWRGVARGARGSGERGRIHSDVTRGRNRRRRRCR